MLTRSFGFTLCLLLAMPVCANHANMERTMRAATRRTLQGKTLTARQTPSTSTA
jgi:hypothetical protein